MRVPISSLGDVERTALVPLFGRAMESRNPDGLFRDPRAIEIVAALDYDFRRHVDVGVLVGTALRTAIFDSIARDWLRRYPESGVIELGVGLSTRFERLDNGCARWTDVDLPRALSLRRRFFAETDRRRMVQASASDRGWTTTAKADGPPHLVIAEGVLPYLSETDVRGTLALIARHLPGARVVFDTIASPLVHGPAGHGRIAGIRAPIKWTCKDAHVVEQWGTGLRLLASRTLADPPSSIGRRLPLFHRSWLAAARACVPHAIDSYRINLVVSENCVHRL